MKQNTELNYMINSLYRVEKWHLNHFLKHNPEKFEQMVRYHLRKNNLKENEENIEYVRKKLGSKNNYGMRNKNG